MPSIADLSRLAENLDAVLPQTQCRRCGYDGCRPYAEAVAAGDAINRCPPGGDPVIAALAALTGRPALPLDRGHGEHTSLTVARIDEARCIGCTLCIAACPVDAIVGAAKRMHIVLSAFCAGCELCLAPCPVDCIAMLPAGRAWSAEDARAARTRHENRRDRLAAGGDGDGHIPVAPASPPDDNDVRAVRQRAVTAALARARARRAAAGTVKSSPA